MMKSPSAKPPASFEAALQELEELVKTLESGGARLEQSLQDYERGMLLLKYCQETLGQAEQKIRMLDNGVLGDVDARAAAGGEGAGN